LSGFSGINSYVKVFLVEAECKLKYFLYVMCCFMDKYVSVINIKLAMVRKLFAKIFLGKFAHFPVVIKTVKSLNSLP